jgi:hypothetical protein
MAQQAIAAPREEAARSRSGPPGAQPPPTLSPIDAWTAAARIAPLLGLTAARDDDPSLRLAEVVDRSLHYAMSRFTLGLSPTALAEAYFDWLVHLSLSPGKQLQLWHKGVRKGARLSSHLVHCMTRVGEHVEPCICPLPQDRRFESAEWHKWPFNLIHQSFPAAAAVVAQRNHWNSRRIGPARTRAGIREPADPRLFLTVKLPPDQPRRSEEDPV